MLRRRRAIIADERGLVLVFVALGFLAFVSAAMLAVDVGMFMVARTQAQNSADAGALAGAVALVFDDYTDHSATGAAVQSALGAARLNQVMGNSVSVTPADITFPAQDEVQVNVFRTSDRGNPVSTLVASFFGIAAVDIGATATAEAAPANASTCVKPWAVPDKWSEQQTPPWDETDEFNVFYENGPNASSPLPNPDIYIPADQEGYTGYDSNPTGPDFGRQILLKAGNPNQAISPGHFFPTALPPDSGASWYEQNITGCWPSVMQIGEMFPMEPGNMVGPTRHGTDALIDQDPSAYWDDGDERVISSYHPSPRTVVVPVFNPMAYEQGRQGGRVDIQVANLVGFFIEGMVGNNVLGRLVPMTGLIRSTGGDPVPDGSFLRAIRLVE